MEYSDMHTDLLSIFQEGERALDNGDYRIALKQYKQLNDLSPNNIDILNILGLIYLKLEIYSRSIDCYQSISRLENNFNPSTYLTLATILIYAQRYPEAITILEKIIKFDQNSHIPFELIATAYLMSGEPHKAFNCSLEGLQRNPGSKYGFNNLGSALRSLVMSSDAKIAFEAALDIDPTYYEARLNLGALQAAQGDHRGALITYDLALKNLSAELEAHRPVILFYAAISQLSLGLLKEGWDNYEYGFSNLILSECKRSPRRLFNVPQWNGDNLENKKLLIWREQGISDEILFMSCFNDLNISRSSIIIECSDRLVETFRRSFPGCLIRPESNIDDGPIQLTDYDFHLPMGSLMKHTRKSLSDFAGKAPYITVSPEKVKKFKSRLDNIDPIRPKIGISWRSGIKSPLRDLEIARLDNWSQILTDKDAVFVNLQYGDCESELKSIEEQLGIQIYRWRDIDLKNDLDDVFALIASLDLVITTGTAVYSMAGAVGVPTFAMMKPDNWTELGLNFSPWYANVKIFKTGETISSSRMDAVSQDFKLALNRLRHTVK